MDFANSIYAKKKFKFEELNIYQENTSITGEHYAGKTRFALECIAKPLLKVKNVKIWVWDAHGIFARSGYFSKEQIVYYLDELSEGTQCYVPEEKSENHFNEFCKLITSQYNLHAILDELHDYMTAQRMAKELQPLIRDVAANQGVTYTAIWQRISEGHKAVISNARHKFLFNYDIADQDRYLKIFGTKADLFLEPEARKYFGDCKICGKVAILHKDKQKINHEFIGKYPPLEQFSFLYKDDKSKESEVFNGGY